MMVNTHICMPTAAAHDAYIHIHTHMHTCMHAYMHTMLTASAHDALMVADCRCIGQVGVECGCLLRTALGLQVSSLRREEVAIRHRHRHA
jgi:hypothetical protein